MLLYLTFTMAKVKIKLLSYFFPNSHGWWMNIYWCKSIYLSIYLSICLSVCLWVIPCIPDGTFRKIRSIIVNYMFIVTRPHRKNLPQNASWKLIIWSRMEKKHFFSPTIVKKRRFMENTDHWSRYNWYKMWMHYIGKFVTMFIHYTFVFFLW